MATLTPLTVGNATTPSGWVSAPNGALGDNSDATYGYFDTNADLTADQGWLLGDVDADFGTIIGLSVVLRYGWASAPSSSVWELAAAPGTLGLRCRIMSGATVLAAADSGGTFQTVVNAPVATTPTNSSSVPFAYVDTAATKTQWDAGVVEIRINRNRIKGGSSEEQRVYEADFTGTYNIASTPATVTPAAIVVTATIPTPSVTAVKTATIAATAKVVTATVPNATVDVSQPATITCTAIVATATVNDGTVAHTAVIAPAAIVATATLPTPTVTTPSGATVTPAAIAAVATVNDAAATAAATVAPASIVATVTVPTPTVEAVTTASITPTAVAATATVPTPAVTATAGFTTTAVVATATIPTPSVGTGSAVSATITPASIVATVTLPTPTSPHGRQDGGLTASRQGGGLTSSNRQEGSDV